MSNRVTEEEKSRMRELKADGWTYAAIAREAGCCKTTVACVCDKEYAAKRKAEAKARCQTPEYEAKQKARRQTPEWKTYMKEFCNSPDQKAKRKAYRNTKEAKAKKKIRESSPKYKAWQKAYMKDYFDAPERKTKQKSYRNSPEYKAYCVAYQKYFRNTIQGKLGHNLRERLRRALDRNFKTGSAVRDLGCTINELKAHLEALFRPGMTWDNWSFYGWHIDHIKPLASFDLTDREQFLQACHYTNLQPLWAEENLAKGGIYE